MPSSLRLLLVLTLALCATGCASAGKKLSSAAGELNATLYTGETVLAAGDTIQIFFPQNETWTTNVLVRPDGTASFPFLDDVSVAGKTLSRLDDELTKSYEETLQVPEIALNVTEWGTREVIVMGEVLEPGAIAMTGGQMSLLEAIGRAGGHNRITALLKQVVLVRWLPDRRERRAWQIDARPSGWDNSKPILLQPLDVIYIPNKPIDKVDIWVDQYIRQMIPLPTLIPPAGA